MTSPEDPTPESGIPLEAPTTPVDAPVELSPATAAEAAAPESAAPEARPAPKAAPKAQRSFWRELPFLIIIALVLALLIKTFLVQAFYIPSASMEPTLNGGSAFSGAPPNLPYDRVLVNKLVYRFRTPRRGEIVVFKRPSYWTNDVVSPESTGIVHWLDDLESDVGIPVSSTEDIIKRVIGVPGDVVKCSSDDVLTVNGHVLNEPFIYPGNQACLYGGQGFTVKVAPGHLFVMGDHRDDSADSRANMTGNNFDGAIPIKNVVGRAFLVIWPHSDWKVLHVPSTFKQQGLAAVGANPIVAGLAGALPIAFGRRRWKLRRRKRA